MQKIDISTSTLVRAAIVVLAIWFAYFIRDVFALLFIVLIIVTWLSPTVERWSKYLTRPGAVISVFLLLLVFVATVFSLLIPPLVDQLQAFSNNLPTYTERLSQSASTGIWSSIIEAVRYNLASLSSNLSDSGSLLLSKTVGLLNGLWATITVIVLSFYLLLEKDGLKKIYKGLLPDNWYEALAETTRKIGDKLGSWLRGQLMLMLLVGVMVTIAMLLINIPYALTLGLWSGLTEVVPIIGPLLGAVPGVALGLAISPIHGFLAILAYTVIQQVENSLLVPKIMGKAVGINPILVILAIIIGNKIYGLMGVLLSVPAAAVISVIAQDWTLIKHTFASSQISSKS